MTNDKSAEASGVYAERYVAFIDILGFSEHVRRSERVADDAQKLINVLKSYAGLRFIGIAFALKRIM